MYKLNRNLNYFLFANVLILLYILMVSILNIPTNDDWAFLNRIDNIGIFGFIKDSYNNWQGRFSYYFIFSLFLKLYSYTQSTFLIILFLITIGVHSIFSLNKRLFKNFDKKTNITLALFIFNISILGALDFTSFFWICASAYYIIIYSTIYLIILLLSPKNFINFILLIFNSIIVGGGAESYSSFVILFLFLYFLYDIIKWKRINSKVALTLIITSICFIIMLKAPGNIIRMNLYKQSNSVPLLLRNSIKPYSQLSVYILPKYLLYIFSSLPFIIIGSKYKLHEKFNSRIFNLRTFFISFFLLLTFYYISILPGIYATSFLTPLRALNHLTLITIIFFSFWGYVYGNKFYTYKNYHLDIISFILISYSFLNFFNDIPRLYKYRESVENRIIQLKKINSTIDINSDTVILIKPLNVMKYKNLSSYIYCYFDKIRNGNTKNNFDFFPVLEDEITNDPNDFRNLALKDHLNLKFKVIIKNN